MKVPRFFLAGQFLALLFTCGSCNSAGFRMGGAVPQAEAGWVDVTKAPWNADSSGKSDASDAIQRAMDSLIPTGEKETNRRNRTLYFPAGTYLVTKPLSFGKNASHSMRLHLRGEGPEQSVIRLGERSPGFDDATAPRAVISFLDASWSNIGFFNSFSDMTIEVGAGNPGATALNIHVNNVGSVRNAMFRSLDSSGAGHSGIRLGQELSGDCLIKDVTVEGFDYGVENDDGAQYGIWHTIEDLRLRGQKKAGILSRRKGLSIRRLDSRNSVPALVQDEAGGQVVLLDSVLSGGDAATAAVVNESGRLFARNIMTEGYGFSIRSGSESLPAGTVSEYVSERGVTLWEGEPARSRGLPVVETPPAPALQAADWTVVGGADGEDISTQLQAAIDSGKRGVFIRPGIHVIGRTIELRGNLEILHGGWSSIEIGDGLLNSGTPVFRFSDEGGSGTLPPVVSVEAFDRDEYGKVGSCWFFQHDSGRDLVLRDLLINQSAAYRNSGKGRLFVENVFSGSPATLMNDFPRWVITDQDAWLRQFNAEGSVPTLVNNGGRVWMLGGKLGEKHGPFVVTMNGGTTEILGVHLNTLPDHPLPPHTVAIINDNSDVTIVGYERSSKKQGHPHPVLVRESRGAETRELLHENAPERGGAGQTGAILPIYRGTGGSFSSHTRPVVGFVTSETRTVEGGSPARLVLKTDHPSDSAIPVNLRFTGNALGEVENLPSTVVIPQGADSATLEITATDDVRAGEPPGTLQVQITGGPDYRTDLSDGKASVFIEDNDFDLNAGLEARYDFSGGKVTDLSAGKNDGRTAGTREGSSPGGHPALVFSGGTSSVLLSDKIDKPSKLPGGPREQREFLRNLQDKFLHRRFSARSVSLHFNVEDSTAPQILFEEGGQNTGLALRVSGGAIEARVASGGMSATAAAPLPEGGGWHAVSVVFDGGRLALWLDGHLAASAEAPFREVEDHASAGGLGLSLGGDVFNGGTPSALSGSLAHVWIHMRALVPKEIEMLSTAVPAAPRP